MTSQVGVASCFGDLGGRSNGDPWMLVHPLDEVVRHTALQAWSAHDDSHGPRVFGHVKRRLAGGVAPADNDDVAAF